MATFSYSALDTDNVLERGTVQARSQHRAVKAIAALGLSVITVQRVKSKTWWNIELTSSFGLPEKILFTRHLHTMMEAGVGLDQALKTLADQTPQEKPKKMMLDLQRRVQGGQAFHLALKQYPKEFSELYISLIRVGEVSGKFDTVLKYLLVQHEREFLLRTKTVNAMIYPSIILTALIAMVSLMLLFVIPNVTGVLKGYNVALPISTRILLALSFAFTHFWYIIFPGAIALMWLFRKFIRRPRGKRWWDTALLRLPAIGEVVREFHLARLTRTLSSTLLSGIALDQALQLASTTTTHTLYRESLLRSVDFIRRGVSIHEVLQGYPKLYPPLVTRMVEVGEKTGKLDQMLERLASAYEVSVENKLTNLSSVVEPILILVIGGVVAFVAVSVMLPIWSFSKTV